MMTMLCALALFLQQDLAHKLDKVADRLSSEKLEERDKARHDLKELAKTDRKASSKHLQARWEREKDAEVKASLADVLAGLTTLDDVKMEIVFPSKDCALRQVNSSKSAFRIRLTNDTGQNVVLYRNWAIAVLDSKGNSVPLTLNLGWWGKGPSGCFLVAHAFLTMPTAGNHDVEEGIAHYGSDAECLRGFRIPSAGTYTVKLTYAFSQKAFKGQCKGACKDHDEPDKPWNRALEGEKTFEAMLVVREETETEKKEASQREKWLEELTDKIRNGKIDEKEFKRLLKEELTPEEQQKLLKDIVGVPK